MNAHRIKPRQCERDARAFQKSAARQGLPMMDDVHGGIFLALDSWSRREDELPDTNSADRAPLANSNRRIDPQLVRAAGG
jgi:L-aminopeptidase/D-esterase-like protein